MRRIRATHDLLDQRWGLGWVARAPGSTVRNHELWAQRWFPLRLAQQEQKEQMGVLSSSPPLKYFSEISPFKGTGWRHYKALSDNDDDI